MAEARRHAVIIGGGAAGFFGAIRCAEANPDCKVTLLEATRRVLTKVLISGGGRCNVTHHQFDPAKLVENYPRGSRELRGPFSRFQPKDTVAWFKARGVELKVEADGRMFPTTDDSKTIASCLGREASRLGVDVRLGASVNRVMSRRSPTDPSGPGDDDSYKVILKDGAELHADAVLLATGSAPFGHDLAAKLGHQIVSPVPSLFTFNVKDPRLDNLAGVAFREAQLTLTFAESKERLERLGPMLITHWGLSGPAVLKLSAFGAIPLHAAKYHAKLTVNFLPDMSVSQAAGVIRQYKADNPRQKVIKNGPFESLPRRFWERLVAVVNVADTYADMTGASIQRLAEEVCAGTYQVAGKGIFKEEFVTAGGVSLKEVDFRTMESRVSPGIYFAGEVLDIDGITGGFNFQAAWTTSWIAGGAMLTPPA